MPTSSRVSSVRARLDRTVLTGLLSLPDPVQRLLGGRPVRRDGLTLATDVQLSLRLQKVARIPGPHEVPLARGREVLRETTATTGGDQPIGAVRPLTVAGLPARLYVPLGAPDDGPLLVFFHGGGFFSGDLDTHEQPCRYLATESGVRVLSVAYRLAPEHPFPAAHDDAVSAYAWVVEHAAELGADPERLGVGGDSAGGNLAAHVAIQAAREGWPCALQLLVYPTTDAEHPGASPRLFADGFYLTSTFMDAADAHLAAPHDDPRVSPMRATLPDGLAPAVVYTAGFDPLRDEGEAYADRLRASGVPTQSTRFPEQIHGFFNVVGVGRSAPAAVQHIARSLRDALR